MCWDARERREGSEKGSEDNKRGVFVDCERWKNEIRGKERERWRREGKGGEWWLLQQELMCQRMIKHTLWDQRNTQRGEEAAESEGRGWRGGSFNAARNSETSWTVWDRKWLKPAGVCVSLKVEQGYSNHKNSIRPDFQTEKCIQAKHFQQPVGSSSR